MFQPHADIVFASLSGSDVARQYGLARRPECLIESVSVSEIPLPKKLGHEGMPGKVAEKVATITALAKDYSKDPDEILEWKYGKVYNLLFTNLQSHLFRERLNKELERKAQQKANARKPRNKWR